MPQHTPVRFLLKDHIPCEYHGTSEERRQDIGDKVDFDLESIFLLLLIVGQQRDMELVPIFRYELCAVPPSLVDEYGCLHKGNKAPLVERLVVKLQLPDVVIMNVQQLMYHVIWPCGGTVESLNARLVWSSREDPCPWSIRWCVRLGAAHLISRGGGGLCILLGVR